MTAIVHWRRYLDANFDVMIDALLLYHAGIGKAMASALSEHDVTHPMHLVALFFLCERDEIKFILSLEEHSVKNKYARDCAEAFVHKFRNI